MTREYIADTEGITAIWFKKLRKSYSWSEFEIVQSYTVRTYSGPEKWILCSRIPVKEIFEGETTSNWVQGRPFQVLYMFKMLDEKNGKFVFLSAAEIHPARHRHKRRMSMYFPYGETELAYLRAPG